MNKMNMMLAALSLSTILPDARVRPSKRRGGRFTSPNARANRITAKRGQKAARKRNR